MHWECKCHWNQKCIFDNSMLFRYNPSSCSHSRTTTRQSYVKSIRSSLTKLLFSNCSSCIQCVKLRRRKMFTMNRNRLEEASCWYFDYDDHVKTIIGIDLISNRSDQISIHRINCFLNYFAHIDKHSDIENVDVRRWNQATSLNQSHRTILIICTRNIDHWTLLIHHTKNGWLSLDFVSLCGWLVGNKPLRGIPWKLASELSFSTSENLFKYF